MIPLVLQNLEQLKRDLVAIDAQQQADTLEAVDHMVSTLRTVLAQADQALHQGPAPVEWARADARA